ncbi:MAG: hypothetical protein ACTHJT_00240 [Cytophaga sp.]|uniref:hypothetical protein n=1 Tax=Cytophaga sp. TaxID=29535 RepID=UPI003F7FAF1A
MTSLSFSPLNSKAAFYAFIYLVLIVLIPHGGHFGDMQCWKDWASFSFKNGLGDIYSSGTDYPPLYHYILTFFAYLKGNEDLIRNNIYELKYITLLFEFASVFLLFKFINKEQRPFFFVFIMLNPGFLYNNIIWGQVDGIVGFLLMACVLSLISRKNTLGLLLYVLALNFKVQSIIYFPLVLFILVHNIADFNGIKRIALSVLAIAVLQVLIIMPFILTGSTNKLMDVIVNSVDKYPQVSMNAYNWWFWVFEEHPISILDNGTWLNVTYKTWGLLIFFLSSVAALLPLFLTCLANIFSNNKLAIKRIDLVFASAALVTILFFFCNTQMHERYSHYALIFLAGYFAVTNNYLPFLLACFAYFLNMEAVLRILNFPNYDILFFNPEFIAILYLILIFVLYYIIYKRSELLLNIKQLLDSLLLKNKKAV